jgi:cytochrome b subunit of formate dehydrogenase
VRRPDSYLRWILGLLIVVLTAVLGCRTSEPYAKVYGSSLTAGPDVPLASPDTLKTSVHASLDCSDCHAPKKGQDAARGTKDDPAGWEVVSCAKCHEKAAKDYAASIHGTALAEGKSDAAHCSNCHGNHDIKKVTDRDSMVFKLRLPFTCARCHKNPEVAKRAGIKEKDAANHYMDSIHGRGLLNAGLLVAPSCVDCHGGSHGIQKASDPRSTVHHTNVPHTCGKCHLGVEEVYVKSVHGELLAKGDPRGPVCTDCHTSHEIIQPTRAAFKIASDDRCGKCHEDRLARYRESYHGKAILLGQENVAACYDCHGHHDVLPSSNPSSRLSPENKKRTCQQCHEKANDNFVGYYAHGDHSDKENYPILYWTFLAMSGLLLGTFAFFGVHTILWFTRSLVLFLRDPKAFRMAKKRMRKDDEGRIFVRFRPVDRFCHFLVIVSFLLLAITGMPLKFYYAGWAQWMFDWMGGASVAAALHRFGAILTFTYFAIHIASMVRPIMRRAGEWRDAEGKFRIRLLLKFAFGPDSPLPALQDLKDFWAHQKWFFGRGPRPQWDRWTYWEKFDYLAVFWGVGAIGLSGLIMWFPEFFTGYLPGWSINLALVIHSDEALLASGFIFTFHFFNVHFRVEKFPMDPVIFSGRISEEEMREERGRLFARLESAGNLEKETLTDEWKRWKLIFIPIGMLAFTIGVVLIVAIYYAMAARMLHG